MHFKVVLAPRSKVLESSNMSGQNNFLDGVLISTPAGLLVVEPKAAESELNRLLILGIKMQPPILSPYHPMLGYTLTISKLPHALQG